MAVAVASVVAVGAALALASGGGGHGAAPPPPGGGPTTTTTSVPAAGSTTTTGPATTTTTTIVGPAGGPVPAGFAPVSVTFVSPTEGWALGTAPCSNPVCTSVVRTTDGGTTWVGIPAPVAPLTSGTAAGGDGVGRIVFADPADGWAYGPGLWSTHDGGATWHRLARPAGESAITSLVASGDAAYAVGSTANGSGAPQLSRAPVTTDSFSVVGSAPAGSEARLAASGGHVWAIAASWFAVAQASGGGFVNRPDPCPAGTSISAVGAFASSVVVACASDAGLGSVSKTVLVSGDGGSTFVTLPAAPRGGDLEAVATNGSTVVVAASSGASELYARPGAGAGWTTPYSDPSGGAPFSDLGFTTASQAVVVEGLAGPGPAPFLLMSHDAGASWARVRIR